MKRLGFVLIYFFAVTHQSGAQSSFAKWTSNELILNNGVVQRIINLPASTGNFITTSYKPITGDYKYFESISPDFQFEVNGIVYSGKSNWRFGSIKSIADENRGNGAAVTLRSQDQKVEVTIRFLLYPNNPAVRKNLVIKNLDSKAVSLESVDVEKFTVTRYYPSTFSWIYKDYGRQKSIGPYEGNMQDALMVVHNMDWEAGIVIGNESTGVLKRTSLFWEAAEITTGLTHAKARYPFRKWIKPGESFGTPQVFTMVYNNEKDPSEIMNTAIPDFVRKHMGIRLSVLKEKPTFVYNTWNPFKTDINEKLIMELAKAAADAGMKEFVIDDGWEDNLGDWGVDKAKFPNGLKPVFDYIKSLGMKPGLWVSVGSASSVSKVYHKHPEWFVHDRHGQYANLQIEGEEMDVRSACFSTGWKDYIRDILLKLAIDYGLEYLKLDFAVVSSAYVFDYEKSGCYAKNHSGHTDHHESMYVNYERMWELFDELHKAKPELFIDCTFEAMGGLQLIDYAMLKHAEGNWLSNFDGVSGEKTDLRVRQMAWWRSPAIPATALVIGNPQMQDKGWELHIQSIAGALPIMLGDPRKLSSPDLKKYRAYADWLQQMENKHGIMSFRQDLFGFGEPAEGRWDGFQRINTETKSGGLVGIFKQGARDTERQVFISNLDPTQQYLVKDALSGNVIITAQGSELETKGFKVSILDAFGGRLFEVAKI